MSSLISIVDWFAESLVLSCRTSTPAALTENCCRARCSLNLVLPNANHWWFIRCLPWTGLSSDRGAPFKDAQIATTKFP